MPTLTAKKSEITDDLIKLSPNTLSFQAVNPAGTRGLFVLQFPPKIQVLNLLPKATPELSLLMPNTLFILQLVKRQSKIQNYGSFIYFSKDVITDNNFKSAKAAALPNVGSDGSICNGTTLRNIKAKSFDEYLDRYPRVFWGSRFDRFDGWGIDSSQWIKFTKTNALNKILEKYTRSHADSNYEWGLRTKIPPLKNLLQYGYKWVNNVKETI